MIIRHEFGEFPGKGYITPNKRPGRRADDNHALLVGCGVVETVFLTATILSPLTRSDNVGFDQFRKLANADQLPTMIVSPLFSSGFDAIELAGVLASCGFKGRYLALSKGLPNSAIVRREVSAAYPGLEFDILDFENNLG